MNTSHIKLRLAVRPKTRLAALAAVCLVLVTAAVSGAAETGITCRGTYEYAVYQGAVFPRYAATYNFEVFVSGNSWVISYEGPTARTNPDEAEEKGPVAGCPG